MKKTRLALKLESGHRIIFSRPGGLSGVLMGHVMLGITEVGELEGVPQEPTNQELRAFVEAEAAKFGLKASSKFDMPRRFDIV